VVVQVFAEDRWQDEVRRGIEASLDVVGTRAESPPPIPFRTVRNYLRLYGSPA
jgi:hypothetical protein